MALIRQDSYPTPDQIATVPWSHVASRGQAFLAYVLHAGKYGLGEI